MKKGKLIKVLIEPDGMAVHVPAGMLLSKVVEASGRPVEAPCGGAGTCGKCRITVVSGDLHEPSPAERRALTQEDIASGTRLACCMNVQSEITISIPESSRSKVQKILRHGHRRECVISSGISKIHCSLPKPSLDDGRAEFRRLADHLSRSGIAIRLNLGAIRSLSSVLKRSEYDVTAVMCADELIAVEPGDTTGRCYGIAFDLGSTTIVGYLMDLMTGEELGVEAAMNPQVVHGDDLIARISFASTQENGLGALQGAAVDAMNRIAESLIAGVDGALENIYKVTVVGNTCMTHLLLGIDVASLGQSPYVPTLCKDIQVSARNLGLLICPEGQVTVLPNIAGFVGSDTVGVMLSTKWENDGRTRLAVDIGTNGEMALMHDGRTYVCSAAAGPAFEGAEISSGMRGAPGAIDSVSIGETLVFSTIGDLPAIGICGSGLVDAIAQMLDAGIVDETGRMLAVSDAGVLPEGIRDRLIETGKGTEFVIATKKESRNGRAISLTSGDIRRVQLAKGSIHAAIQTLIREAGITDTDLDEILLAGAFGNYISVLSAIRIGLIPRIAERQVISIGNAAGAGARLALLAEEEMDLARRLASSAEHIELALSPHYQMELMERMMFPGTDFVSV